MGVVNSKEKKKLDEATSNSSLSNIRYVITEKPKWKVFRKREVVPIPAYQTSTRPMKGCNCGSNGPCKQRITPKGVTMHYPQKKKKFSRFRRGRRLLGKSDRPFYNTSIRNVRSIRPRRFPSFKMNNISYKGTYGFSFNRKK